ncbi:MAG TPA: S-adenosylmethionine:tRNA ribosyltransferase-isomerase [Acidimicrobiia bacterium]
MTAPTVGFTVPEGQAATAPPEERGLCRDEVKLLVASPGQVAHTTFRHLGEYLSPGDVVVVNTSATRAAAIDGVWRRGETVVHFSNRLPSGRWIIELRRVDGRGPILDAATGDVIELAGGASAVLEAPLARRDGGVRLWKARVAAPESLDQHLVRHGRAITYGYVDRPWPLSAYQTVFARPDDPSGASAEMPSAARPFTTQLVASLVSAGILVVPITLHAGVSSPERNEPPPAEPYRVPRATAEAVNAARHRGNRVVAVGTTVTRALESAVDDDGTVHAREGWTDLVLSAERPARVVKGLVTGWHPPEASHLLLLEAVAGADLVRDAYEAAVATGYLWHEFGDSCLLLPLSPPSAYHTRRFHWI